MCRLESLITEFIELLGVAGIRITISEKMDCFKILKNISIFDRKLFYYTLRSTLVKSYDHYPTFNYIFNEFFFFHRKKARKSLSKNKLIKNLKLKGINIPSDDLSQSDLSQPSSIKHKEGDSDEVENALNKLASPYPHSDLLKQLLLSSQYRIDQLAKQLAQEHMGKQEETKGYYPINKYSSYEEKRGKQKGKTKERGKTVVSSVDIMDWNAVNINLSKLLLDLTKTLQGSSIVYDLSRTAISNLVFLKERILFYLQTILTKQSVDNRKEIGKKLNHHAVLSQSFQTLDLNESSELRIVVQKLAQRLATRMSNKKKSARTGKLNIKKTLRTSVQYGGTPISLDLLKRRVSKPEIVALCDISGSVIASVEFFLLFLSELHNFVSKVKSFAFVSDIDEINYESVRSSTEPINSVLKKTAIDHWGYSDFGYAFSCFDKKYQKFLTRRTTLIIIGDARNNYNPSRAQLLSSWKTKVNKIIWLNPEHPSYWDTGDSIMRYYKPYCDHIFNCSNLNQLSVAIENIME